MGVAALSRGSLRKYPYLSRIGLEALASSFSETQLGCSEIIKYTMQPPAKPMDLAAFMIINFH